MRADKFKNKYMNPQEKKALLHKYLESEKAGKDLGDPAILDWITKYAPIFRKEFVTDKLLKRAVKEIEMLGKIALKNSEGNKKKRVEKLIKLCKENVEDAEEAIEKGMIKANGNGKNGNGKGGDK